MRVVVADTSPVLYLSEIQHLDLLPRLFGSVFIPVTVYEELQRPATPLSTRLRLKSPPSWLKIESATTNSDDPSIMALDEGERAALMLSFHLNADLILIDERKGVAAARQREFRTIGTIGVLALAAEHKLVNLTIAFERLRQTNFYCPEDLMAKLLEKLKI